jgi:hypothetical protein
MENSESTLSGNIIPNMYLKFSNLNTYKIYIYILEFDSRHVISLKADGEKLTCTNSF